MKSKLSDFEILAELGKGSYGSAYKVLRKSIFTINKSCFIKIVDSTIYVMKCMPASQNTLKEVSILASLFSLYIVKYMDSFIENGQLYLIMEYCEKGDLLTYINNQMGVPLSESKIWRIALEALAGIALLHTNGIIHRDLKAKNLFLTRNYHIKIGDFGVSQIPNADNIKEIKELGTLLYNSPEILKGEFYSFKADIWSFGCILYELCCLRHPFQASIESSVITKILTQKPASISKEYSKDLQYIIDLCLHKDSNQRPTANDLLELQFVQIKCKEFNIDIPHSLIPKEPKKVQFSGFETMAQKIMENRMKTSHKKIQIKSILKKEITNSFREQSNVSIIVPETAKSRSVHYQMDSISKTNCNTSNEIPLKISSTTKNSPKMSAIAPSPLILASNQHSKLIKFATNSPPKLKHKPISNYIRITPIALKNMSEPPIPKMPNSSRSAETKVYQNLRKATLYNSNQFKTNKLSLFSPIENKRESDEKQGEYMALSKRTDSVANLHTNNEINRSGSEQPRSSIKRIMEMNRLILPSIVNKCIKN